MKTSRLQLLLRPGCVILVANAIRKWGRFMKIFVESENGKQTREFREGQTLLEVLRGYPVTAPCGGKGTCKKCTVYVSGEPVLACRTVPEDGMEVSLTPEAALTVELGQDKEVVSDGTGRGLGMAVDIGTTTVACHLMELETGKTLALLGQPNSQRTFGADVISRISASMEGHLSEMTEAIRNQLREVTVELCRQAGRDVSEITKMTVAANTTMCHLLSGLKPDSMGMAPFTPLSLFGDSHSAGEWGLGFDGEVYIIPCVSAYVGGDITADLLSADMDRAEKPILLIDVGTNGEMALGCGDSFLCCSTAAGPAFEGAQISCGMTAASGAVSEVELRNGVPMIKVIGGGEPEGICGSGLIDALAVMLEMGVMDETGLMLDPEEDDIPENLTPYLFLVNEEPAFRLGEGVYVTQKDVRKVQLGKGAIAAGIEVLLQKAGMDAEDVSRLYLAGGFGSFIRPESAARIGLIPRELLPVTKALGNTAAMGAKMALVSREAKNRLEKLRNNMTYLELSGMVEFNNAYMEHMMFPEE